jgi:glucokinase
MLPSNGLALGIDLGGTNLRIGVVDRAGRVVDLRIQPVDRLQSGEQIVSAIVCTARLLPLLKETSGIGLALSASVSADGSLGPGTTTHPGLAEYPLSNRLASELGRPCLMDNDANLALLGEAHFGAARGLRDVLLLTLGTGVGGGLMLGGRVRRGARSSAAEIGLTQVPVFPGPAFVSLESLSSPGALMRQLKDAPGGLYERAANGDGHAQALIQQMDQYLGMAVANAHILLDLELVILAGGLSNSGIILCEGVRNAFERICPKELQLGLRIELASLPPDQVGVIGAACMWFEEEGSMDRLRQ